MKLKYKNHSDIIDNYNGKDKKITIPCENIIIQKYRYKTGLDEKEVSLPNIIQQRKKFNNEFISEYIRG